ncbi:hypothetical protein H5410_010471, partial [Solanum commersonii]
MRRCEGLAIEGTRRGRGRPKKCWGEVEELNSLVSELAKVTAKEQASLEQCKDFLTMIATMQVKDCSLRTH